MEEEHNSVSWKEIKEIAKKIESLSEDDRLDIINKISLICTFFNHFNINISSLGNCNISVNLSLEELKDINQNISLIFKNYLTLADDMIQIFENKLLENEKKEKKKRRFPFNLSV